ncbi:hypothetical protein F5Y12DRAFT_720333 [Xylaria sp. FL1777]|nr:hypothetical protein F5Y12DRAFT_720333 [Xylaria sp. FL1777]
MLQIHSRVIIHKHGSLWRENVTEYNPKETSPRAEEEAPSGRRLFQRSRRQQSSMFRMDFATKRHFWSLLMLSLRDLMTPVWRKEKVLTTINTTLAAVVM